MWGKIFSRIAGIFTVLSAIMPALFSKKASKKQDEHA